MDDLGVSASPPARGFKSAAAGCVLATVQKELPSVALLHRRHISRRLYGLSAYAPHAAL